MRVLHTLGCANKLEQTSTCCKIEGEFAVRSQHDSQQATELQSVRNLLPETRERIRNIEHLEEHLEGALREIDQRVCDFESLTQHLLSVLIKWGALGAMLAGLAWIASSIVTLAGAGGQGP